MVRGAEVVEYDGMRDKEEGQGVYLERHHKLNEHNGSLNGARANITSDDFNCHRMDYGVERVAILVGGRATPAVRPCRIKLG